MVIPTQSSQRIAEKQLKQALHEKYVYREDLSRKGAKAQSAAAFLKGFLCAFAREIFSSFRGP
jgi:hypothetical protein